jgi:hypothetical protein
MMMTEGSWRLSRRRREGVMGALSVGLFFVVIGVIFITTPDLLNNVISFIRNFDALRVPSTDVYLPAPKTPYVHTAVYSAAQQFSLIWAILEIAMLGLRIVFRSPLRKMAENASSIIFWFGEVYLIPTFLNDTTTLTMWFAYWAAVIMLAGITLIARAVILAAMRIRRD